MLPFFFGSGQRRLFGIYETAAGKAAVGAALLCNSWGTEYGSAHRAMRLLSKRLRAVGFDTLRFDYFGAGDSGGETVDAHLDGWREDISTALKELKDMSGKPRLIIIGLRLGATLVAQSAQRLSVKADGVVLWDPILDGASYLDIFLDQQHCQNEGSSFIESISPGIALTSELGGLLVSNAFVDELKSIDLFSSKVTIPANVLTIFTENQHRGFEIGCSPDSRSEVAILRAPSPWKESTEQEERLPVEVFDRILKWLR
ncbi:alpha/beta hydrolase [Bradyrhizobium sp. CIAT3101]|uniref:serine aminopeptidase domain-containing protein n=1 Tax=Bradyrhizobium sp. CIAT3101 TaxID=439387 RepID=UPI0024B068CF|nr:alpha/beta hydrolase [Bradyrhizobium sp. CIAT3101]WFU79156.1 alpha/beta hydrolase [Bradyrhizobium sp. CIAT3101]